MGERSEPMGSPLGSTTFQQFKALTGRVTIDNVADPGLRGGSVGERLMSATRHP